MAERRHGMAICLAYRTNYDKDSFVFLLSQVAITVFGERVQMT